MNPHTRPIYQRRCPARAVSAIEPLEARIAPAILVSATTVTYKDGNGDTVTVALSKPLFSAALVNKVFTFDTGSVNGDNSAAQQLQTLDLDWFGLAATGLNVSISVPQTNNGPVNVGYINASAINLGKVAVAGDLGRIAAGGVDFSTPALISLHVQSLGAQGIATQAAGGNLQSLFSGTVGSITVNGDIDNASIGIGGGVHGVLGSLKVTGSINGGADDFSGSIRTQGGIGKVEIDGSINGGGGASSGIIGTAGSIGKVLVEGSINGGAGSFSGAILSTGPMLSVQVNGSIVGGAGTDSGQIGTAATLGAILVGTSVEGGGGQLSGVILASGNISSVTITDGLLGGDGQSSGQIGSGKSIGSVTIGSDTGASPAIIAQEIPDAFQGIESGAGAYSGSIVAGGSITTVTVDGYIDADFSVLDTVLHPAIPTGGSGPTINATGNIKTVTVTESVYDAGIISGGSIGNVTIYGTLSEASEISAHLNITEVSVNSVTVSNPGISTAVVAHPLVPGFGEGIVDSTIVATDGTIGTILASGKGYDAIVDSIFQAGGGITKIIADSTDATGIESSGFNTGGNIGTINALGGIDGSVFVAGIDLGTAFTFTTAGIFNNTAAADIGFGSSTSKTAAHIGNVTVTGVSGGPDQISNSIFLSGVHGAGPDLNFGTNDDLVSTGSNIGNLSAPGGFSTVFLESGSIGGTTTGGIADSIYLTTDTGPSAGIGAVTIVLSSNSTTAITTTGAPTPLAGSALGASGISNSDFISNSNIGNINITVNGVRQADTINGALASSTFESEHAMGAITITDNLTGTLGVNYAISNCAFVAGATGAGGMGPITVSITDANNDGNTAAIYDSTFDATFTPGTSANMGPIHVTNADTSSTAAGIVDSTFRVHGNMGAITSTLANAPVASPAIEGSMFSAFGSIGNITTTGSVLADNHGPSRFLAGYDIGQELVFGIQNLATGSTDLNAGQSVGNVTVSGYFEGSDIIASINPGAGYVFGDSSSGASAANDSNVGSGGAIGLISIGAGISVDGSPFVSDYATSHAIEAAHFAGGTNPTVSAFGYTSTIPTVLYVDGESGDVRITNLTQAAG
jgi:hypothetical protein